MHDDVNGTKPSHLVRRDVNFGRCARFPLFFRSPRAGGATSRRTRSLDPHIQQGNPVLERLERKPQQDEHGAKRPQPLTRQVVRPPLDVRARRRHDRADRGREPYPTRVTGVSGARHSLVTSASHREPGGLPRLTGGAPREFDARTPCLVSLPLGVVCADGVTVIKRACFPSDVAWAVPQSELLLQPTGVPPTGLTLVVRSTRTGKRFLVAAAAGTGMVTDDAR